MILYRITRAAGFQHRWSFSGYCQHRSFYLIFCHLWRHSFLYWHRSFQTVKTLLGNSNFDLDVALVHYLLQRYWYWFRRTLSTLWASRLAMVDMITTAEPRQSFLASDATSVHLLCIPHVHCAHWAILSAFNPAFTVSSGLDIQQPHHLLYLFAQFYSHLLHLLACGWEVSICANLHWLDVFWPLRLPRPQTARAPSRQLKKVNGADFVCHDHFRSSRLEDLCCEPFELSECRQKHCQVRLNHFQYHRSYHLAQQRLTTKRAKVSHSWWFSSRLPTLHECHLHFDYFLDFPTVFRHAGSGATLHFHVSHACPKDCHPHDEYDDWCQAAAIIAYFIALTIAYFVEIAKGSGFDFRLIIVVSYWRRQQMHLSKSGNLVA